MGRGFKIFGNLTLLIFIVSYRLLDSTSIFQFPFVTEAISIKFKFRIFDNLNSPSTSFAFLRIMIERVVFLVKDNNQVLILDNNSAGRVRPLDNCFILGVDSLAGTAVVRT